MMYVMGTINIKAHFYILIIYSLHVPYTVRISGVTVEVSVGNMKR